MLIGNLNLLLIGFPLTVINLLDAVAHQFSELSGSYSYLKIHSKFGAIIYLLETFAFSPGGIIELAEDGCPRLEFLQWIPSSTDEVRIHQFSESKRHSPPPPHLIKLTLTMLLSFGDVGKEICSKLANQARREYQTKFMISPSRTICNSPTKKKNIFANNSVNEFLLG